MDFSYVEVVCCHLKPKICDILPAWIKKEGEIIKLKKKKKRLLDPKPSRSR